MTAAGTPEAAAGAAVAAPPPDLVPATAERLLADLRLEAARADTKGSVLVAAQGMAAAALVGVLTVRGWQPESLSALGRVIWWTGTACFLLSLISLLMAVIPRYRSRSWRPGLPLTHFADIHSAARLGQAALAEALRDTERARAAAVLLALTENSRIVAGKYGWLRAGIAGFTASVMLLPGALLVG
ncbi:Pycsar system effector family protein [Streptomyces sp. NBC_00239]|uniref:Pycsar system effector family protein n=1 Tax=Streptomyces sp. NBC_00239 TaxID=2903640 RepID=UPI002E28805B|nr:Pycsar system effector family protein [Streptomyces sp. NBC_00239]